MKELIYLMAVCLGTHPACAATAEAGPMGLHELTASQQKSLDEVIHENEVPGGRSAIRSRITVRSSKVLGDLFPHYRFVLIPWIYQAASPAAETKFQIPAPGAAVSEVALSDDGHTRFWLDTGGNGGTGEEWGAFLHAERVRVSTAAMADKVAAAFFADSYQSGCCRNLRRGTSEWLLGYRESPFRAISSYREIREATYYRLTTDPNGIVMDGKLETELLERRRLRPQQSSGN
jgi:hypothetical protein